MNEPSFDKQEAHRWFAIQWNNEAWAALEAAAATPEQQLRAVHQAHASCLHWQEAGGPLQQLRALCLVANAEAAFGSPQAAVRFADLCQEMAPAVEGLADWDVAFAADARARALASTWRTAREQQEAKANVDWLGEQAKSLRGEARRLGDKIADPDDRQVFDNWHAAGSWHGLDR